MTVKSKKHLSSKDFVKTGSKQLDLAVSGYGWPKGTIVWLCGDSESGKSWFSMSCLAETVLDLSMDDYQLVYDGPEGGTDMVDTVKYFGKAVKDRIRSPKGTKDLSDCSESIEDFYDMVDDLIAAGKPFIVILDSENSLPSRAELKDLKKNKAAHKRGAEEGQSYGTEKAKIHSKRLRILRRTLKKTGSIVIIISQTRDNLGYGAQFNPKKVSGGNALKFFADVQIWTSVKQELRKKIENGQEWPVGMLCKIQVKKNRTNGRKSTIYVPFLHDHGIDDIGGCVRFLVEQGHWKATYDKKSGQIKGKIDATELDESLSYENLIEHIEKNGLEKTLRKTVSRVWRSILSQLKVNRKKRYS